MVYIVEDNTSILESLTFLLEETYQVTPMTDARIALIKIPLEKPDLILLDFCMPDLDGKQFIKALSNQTLKIPIIIMSAYPNIHTQLSGFTISGFIRKPFQINEIVTTIEKVIAQPK